MHIKQEQNGLVNKLMLLYKTNYYNYNMAFSVRHFNINRPTNVIHRWWICTQHARWNKNIKYEYYTKYNPHTGRLATQQVRYDQAKKINCGSAKCSTPHNIIPLWVQTSSGPCKNNPYLAVVLVNFLESHDVIKGQAVGQLIRGEFDVTEFWDGRRRVAQKLLVLLVLRARDVWRRCLTGRTTVCHAPTAVLHVPSGIPSWRKTKKIIIGHFLTLWRWQSFKNCWKLSVEFVYVLCARSRPLSTRT